MSIICTNCGGNNEQGTRFCANCGTSLINQSAEQHNQYQQQFYAPQQASPYMASDTRRNNMNKPSWLDNRVATIFGVIFYAPFVIFAYRLNSYTLRGEPMSGGRLFWRQLGWSFLTSIPLVGLIYGLVKLEDIVETRNNVWEIMQNRL